MLTIDNLYCFVPCRDFTYEPGDWKGVGNVVRLINDIQKKGINTHMLVFTETAFNEDTYKRLLTALSQRYGSENPKQMPIVVAGVAKTENDLPYNELRLATYFAGKWYQLSQHKHHRWQLNASQIQQYNLQGHLSTARPLFERSIMDQRRITFYAPTPWLVLCPLICEDLSRIEPVSELIRGVGPTLVLALLLDGPQLENRWPGRYASVLADDPGTGVLTVTSYGFAKASRLVSKRFDPPESKNGKSDDDYQTVASWKDPTSKFQPLTTSENEAMLLTLTAHLERQFTLDRRETKGKAAGFRLDGIQRFKLPETECDQGIDRRLDSFGNWSDIREVTAVTYIASAALSILRPHYSKHPEKEEANKKTDTWNKMASWCSRVKSVRNLIDIMLGQPLLFKSETGDTKTWIDLINAEKRRLEEKRNDIPQKSIDTEQTDNSGNELNAETPDLPGEMRSENNYGYVKGLKATRNVLLNHILSPADPPEGLQNHQFAHNRHLFAVLAFSQTTIDVEVRDDEAKWPTDSLRFAATVLRILLDSIAGIEFLKGETIRQDSADAEQSAGKTGDQNSQWDIAGKVYLERLKIAGRENRERPTLWNEDDCDNDETKRRRKRRDVKDAPKPLLHNNDQNHTINYFGQFKSSPGRVDFHPTNQPADQDVNEGLNENSDSEVTDHPNIYDFYRMVLALVEAILEDVNPSLWKRCQREFIGHIGDIEMRRLTLLVLMLLPSLIHEQLEYDYIRLKRTDEISIRSKVIHKLIKKAETILKSASIKTGTSWDPRI